MPNIGTTELLVILLVVLVLFGAKRLPDLSRSIGRSARILKTETRGLRDDDTAPEVTPVPPVTTATQVSQVPAEDDLTRRNSSRLRDIA